MKKIINNPVHVVDEMLKGICFVHSDLVDRLEGLDVIVRKAEKTASAANSSWQTGPWPVK